MGRAKGVTIEPEHITVVCPECGFAWHNEHLKQLFIKGGDVSAYLEKMRTADVNRPEPSE